MNSKEYGIIAATHGEPLSWLKHAASKENRNYELIVSCSNGRSEQDFPEADKVISRENWGREAGHYLNYIIENYDNLPSVCVFVQADPWPHLRHKGSSDMFLGMLFNSPPEFDAPFCYLGGKYFVKRIGIKPSMLGGKPNAQYELLSAAWKDEPIPMPVSFMIGAQFYVKREVILARPKQHYIDLMDKGRTMSQSFAHVLEPLWGCVFNHQLT
jgi:hypothetical protein